jgi:hypothetical protein
MESLKDDPSPLGKRAVHLRALGRHLGLQGQDAVKQVLRFAPDDADLVKAISSMCHDMRDFARREADRAIELTATLSVQDVPVPEEVDRGDVDERRTMVVKRLRWRAPADNAFSEAGQAKLRELRERSSGIGRIWNWINCRRTSEELWERVQFGGTVPYEVVAEYLELLIDESFAAEVSL